MKQEILTGGMNPLRRIASERAPRIEAPSHVRAEQGAWASPNSVVEDSRSTESQSQRAREITPILRQILQRSPAPSHWGLNE